VRRLFRILLTTATLISFLLAVGTCDLWIRGKSTQDVLYRYTRTAATRSFNFTGVYSEHGIYHFYSYRRTFDTLEGFANMDGFLDPRQNFREGLNYGRFSPTGPAFGWWFLFRHGFKIENHRWAATPQYYYAGRYSYGLVDVPHWFILLMFLFLPSLWLFRRLRSLLYGSKPGLCPGCGYDMRASGDRCPECGALAQSPASPGATAAATKGAGES